MMINITHLFEGKQTAALIRADIYLFVPTVGTIINKKKQVILYEKNYKKALTLLKLCDMVI